MINTDIYTAKCIFKYMLKNPTYLLKLKRGFFQLDDLQKIAEVAKGFYVKYKETPSCEQMKLLLRDNDFGITQDAIEDYYNVEIIGLDAEFLKQTTEGWIKYQAMIRNMSDAATMIKTSNVTFENAGDLVDKAVDKIAETRMVTFDDDMGLDFFDVENHKSTKEDKIPYTWDFWNKSSGGGLDPKTLTSYIGSTNIGKTIILCNDAAEFIRKGENVLFISCEMSEQKVMRRIAANLYNITLEEYDSAIETGKFKKIAQDFENRSLLPHGKLWVKEYPTGQCTVLDLEAFIKRKEEETGLKINAVVIDYINIMCNYRNPNSENTYLKIKSLAEDLRALAVKYNFVVITASQIGRSALNSSDINIEDISESMGLAHTCDAIIGIIQTEDMQIGEIDPDTGQAVPYYWLKILKIREGTNKNKKFRVNINYSKMKLIEKTEVIDTMSHFK